MISHYKGLKERERAFIVKKALILMIKALRKNKSYINIKAYIIINKGFVC